MPTTAPRALAPASPSMPSSRRSKGRAARAAPASPADQAPPPGSSRPTTHRGRNTLAQRPGRRSSRLAVLAADATSPPSRTAQAGRSPGVARLATSSPARAPPSSLIPPPVSRPEASAAGGPEPAAAPGSSTRSSTSPRSTKASPATTTASPDGASSGPARPQQVHRAATASGAAQQPQRQQQPEPGHHLPLPVVHPGQAGPGQPTSTCGAAQNPIPHPTSTPQSATGSARGLPAGLWKLATVPPGPWATLPIGAPAIGGDLGGAPGSAAGEARGRWRGPGGRGGGGRRGPCRWRCGGGRPRPRPRGGRPGGRPMVMATSTPKPGRTAAGPAGPPSGRLAGQGLGHAAAGRQAMPRRARPMATPKPPAPCWAGDRRWPGRPRRPGPGRAGGRAGRPCGPASASSSTAGSGLSRSATRPMSAASRR